jgi:serine/threonine protein kinase
MNIGPYTLVHEIGRGGMGVVFKAIDPLSGQAVAIKLIKPTGTGILRARTALVREAGATASLQHPNIVSVYDLGQHEGNLYIVMEYLSGASAEILIQQRSPIGLHQKLQIVIQLCDALDHAHGRGVVHFDVKPANIFILRDGTVKVLDFGVAAIAQISDPKAPRFIGTIPYMSPEQVKYSEVVLLGQFEVIAPRVAGRIGLGFGDREVNANELILIKVLSSIPKPR